MVKINFLILIIVFVSIDPSYCNGFNKISYSINTPIYGYNNCIENLEISQNDNKLVQQTFENEIHKKKLCDTILGISYGSAMVGTVVGIVSGLFWAFSKKNKTANMAVCLTGSSLFLVGASAGLITSNVFCKKSDHYSENKFLNKYAIILDLNLKQKDYSFGLSYKF